MLSHSLQQHHDQATFSSPANLQAGRKRQQSEVEAANSDFADGIVRRRISRACDQCNQLRTKCDGKHPCAHCAGSGLTCEYARAHKKRGRAPKKDQEQGRQDDIKDASDTHDQQATSATEGSTTSYGARGSFSDNPIILNTKANNGTYEITDQSTFYKGYDNSSNLAMNGSSQTNGALVPTMMSQQFNMPNASAFSTETLDFGMQQDFGFPLGDDYSVAFMGKAPTVESPDWMALTASIFAPELPPPQPRPPDSLRFPVLQPLLPHIEPIMPQSLACDLIEQYFTSSTSAYLRPSNPYILGHIFRKKSILHPTKPRPCSPALLASMLWIAAQTNDQAFLTSQLDARAKVCQKLLELTINMLKPLVHNASTVVVGSNSHSSATPADASLGLAIASESGDSGAMDRIQIDNLATYIHLATVVSASERKAASLRWWNAAWSLARELRLGRELPPNDDKQDDARIKGTGDDVVQADRRESAISTSAYNSSRLLNYVSEEEREERRRAFWLLYMQDRHLALCYNRPMFFLNKECQNLLQPFDDDTWQSGRFENIDSKTRRLGLGIECTSHSVFGYFLPLMVILGEILDLNHARNRPRFGPKANQPRNWNETTEEITQQLEMYETSLKDFEVNGGHFGEHNQPEAVTPSVASGGTNNTPAASEVALQTQTVVAYGTHILHVLHVLLTGKWDPIALLDDNDLWISSESFVTATGHAVSAAEAVAEVIEHDPDLSFMPFFFGIYLLQGSFLLLLFADKLQGDVSPDVVRACEVICRAHEACVATLDTQYQRNFRKVMRSALQQVRGRIQEDSTEQQNWRREVLKLYRWTGDGTGLAL